MGRKPGKPRGEVIPEGERDQIDVAHPWSKLRNEVTVGFGKEVFRAFSVERREWKWLTGFRREQEEGGRVLW